MALTATAKEELARVPVTRLSERLAEVVGILRFGGGLQLLPGRLIIETELDHEGAARRLRSTLRNTFGTECDLITLQGSSSRRGARYVLRIMEGGAQLARKTGLMDPRGR
ncbi:MAG: DNA-binding protein WhiA, partial [Yaniella sp.]|nr:DNA-binding protein WhiA [Yaniella sp.]